MTVPAEMLVEIASKREVHWIEEHLPVRAYNANAQWVTQSLVFGSRPLWDAGLTGEGQVIEVNDTGVRTTHKAFVDESIPIADFGVYPTHRKIVAYLDGTPNGSAGFGDEYQPYPPYGHGTHVAGSVAGEDGTWSPHDGMAKNAKLVVNDVGRANGQLYSNYPYTMFWNANDEGGATIHNCSWGQDTEGDYSAYDTSCDAYMFFSRMSMSQLQRGTDHREGTTQSSGLRETRSRSTVQEQAGTETPGTMVMNSRQILPPPVPRAMVASPLQLALREIISSPQAMEGMAGTTMPAERVCLLRYQLGMQPWFASTMLMDTIPMGLRRR